MNDVYLDGRRVSLAALRTAATATHVRAWNCPGLTVLPSLPAGFDARGYQFVAACIRGEYRILAGCRALVEKLAAEIASRENGK